MSDIRRIPLDKQERHDLFKLTQDRIEHLSEKGWSEEDARELYRMRQLLEKLQE
ncbi:hypothetical protein ACQPZJ_35485 [Actinoplanes sp. CA-054009]